METMQEELNEMEKAFEEPSAGEDDLRTDPPDTTTLETEAPETTAPEIETDETETPEVEAPEAETDEPDAPETAVPHTEPPAEDPRDKRLRELEEKIARMESAKEPKTEAPSTETPQTDAPISDEDFLGETDLDELTRDPKLFGTLLNKVYKKGIVAAREEARGIAESVVRSIPDIVKNNVALTTRLKKIHDQFYDDNKDLVPWKKSVGVVMEEVIAENPDKTYEDLLPKVATEVRKRLDLHKDASRQKDDNLPNLPRKKGGSRQQPKPDTNPLLTEFDEMDKALGID